MSTIAAAPTAHEASAWFPAPSRSSVERLDRLDALLDRSCAELRPLYEGARAPRIGDVAGDLRGRMLAWTSLESRPRLAVALRSFAGSKSFPWRGKSFMPKSETDGDGINRVFSDRFRLFRFET